MASSDADIRASSDRYLRNSIIAVLAYDRESTLWDAARLLSVGEEGYSYRSSVGARVRTLPEFKEISQFFTAELSAQLADARSMTTAKLDAPVNKLARLLNSASIKRVLLNDSLRVDFDRVIAGEEVLVVKGALGAMGAGNTSVLMQLLVGMLDAALGRQQDLVPAQRRVTVALKVDEAPLVLNRGFAETMALKRSAGLETVACWQADSQWIDRDIRDQLDALFAHRVYFATASTREARAAVGLTMAEYSDSVRPAAGHVSTLGQPDVRLHLPRHHAIVSWTTQDGRQAPFIAETIPLRVDHARLEIHAASQLERGGRHRTDLRQPHWDHKRAGTQSAQEDTPALTAGPANPRAGHDGQSAAPAAPADSYRELVELDGAHNVRWAKPADSHPTLEPDPLDLEILALIASLTHVLTSQLHRRFNRGRSATTTQRRLKRLSDAGLVGRFQFHRRDGGGVPMCYVITALGLELLRDSGRVRASDDTEPATVRQRSPKSASDRDGWLRQARHDVHVAGWALALEQAAGGARPTVRGSAESVLSPPMRSTPDGKVGIGPADLRLPGGRAAHDFLRSNPLGEGIDIERFETVRPDAIVEMRASHQPSSTGVGEGEARRVSPVEGSADPDEAGRTGRGQAIDVIIELDNRLPAPRSAGKLERYDHFLAGWSVHTRRYGPRMETLAVVVFVCRDRARARECARRADPLLKACRAYAGEYPFDWEYPGREGILFAAERDVHEGLLRAYGVPRLPPEVRVTVAHGDPRAREATVEARAIPGSAERPDE